MSLFRELKRRNVFRVGIAYVIGAWLVLQLTEVLSELLNLPEEFGPIVVALIALGFPLVLFFAWAFELTPEGIKREQEVDRSQSITRQTGRRLDRAIIVMLVIVAGYFIWESRFSEREPDPVSTADVSEALSDTHQQPRSDQPVSAKPADRKSIAVLPFQNRSDQRSDEYFVEGVHDDLLTNLARIGSLKVISRTSVLRYKDTKKPIPEIADELGVATVMEGAVQRAGETVRINVQLIDAETDEHLWAEIFDRQLTTENLFAIQTEISEAIAQELKATLSPEEQERISERPTENLAAYNAYLRGRQLMTRRNSADMEQAAQEFARAVELDPDFALAWVGVAETASLLSTYSTLGIQEAMERQESATKKALELNDELGEAHLSMATIHSFYNRYEEAEKSFRRAIELSPGYATAYQWYSNFVDDYPHRLGEATRLIDKAVELDPLSSIIRINRADKLIALGRFAEAEAQLKRLLELDPEFPVAYAALGRLMGILGRFDEKVRWIQKSMALDPGRIQLYLDLTFALLDLGDDQSVEQLREKIESLDDQHFAIGGVDMLLSMHRGNYTAALESANWVNERIGRIPEFQDFFGLVYTVQGDFNKALGAYRLAEPRFFDRRTWRAAIEQGNAQGCINAWLMIRTGDEETGRDLLDTTLAYMEVELPNYIEHADRYAYSACYLARGDLEKAMDAFEVSVEHGHYSGWWMWSKLPLWEPLRGDPRFEAALAKIEEEVARQRSNLSETEFEVQL